MGFVRRRANFCSLEQKIGELQHEARDGMNRLLQRLMERPLHGHIGVVAEARRAKTEVEPRPAS